MMKKVKYESFSYFVPPQPSCMLVLSCIKGAQSTAHGTVPKQRYMAVAI